MSFSSENLKMVRLATVLGYPAFLKDGWCSLESTYVIHANSYGLETIKKALDDPGIISSVSAESLATTIYIADKVSDERFIKNLEALDINIYNFSAMRDKDGKALGSYGHSTGSTMFTTETFMILLAKMKERAEIKPEEEDDLAIIGEISEAKEVPYTLEEINNAYNFIKAYGISLVRHADDSFQTYGMYGINRIRKRGDIDRLRAISGPFYITVGKDTYFFNKESFTIFCSKLEDAGFYSLGNHIYDSNSGSDQSEVVAEIEENDNLLFWFSGQRLGSAAERAQEILKIEPDDKSGLEATGQIFENEGRDIEKDLTLIKGLGYNVRPEPSGSNLVWPYQYKGAYQLEFMIDRPEQIKVLAPILRRISHGKNHVYQLTSQEYLNKVIDSLGYRGEWYGGSCRLVMKDEPSRVFGYMVDSPNTYVSLKSDDIIAFSDNLREFHNINKGEEYGIEATTKLFESQRISQVLGILKGLGIDIVWDKKNGSYDKKGRNSITIQRTRYNKDITEAIPTETMKPWLLWSLRSTAQTEIVFAEPEDMEPIKKAIMQTVPGSYARWDSSNYGYDIRDRDGMCIATFAIWPETKVSMHEIEVLDFYDKLAKYYGVDTQDEAGLEASSKIFEDFTLKEMDDNAKFLQLCGVPIEKSGVPIARWNFTKRNALIFKYEKDWQKVDLVIKEMQDSIFILKTHTANIYGGKVYTFPTNTMMFKLVEEINDRFDWHFDDDGIIRERYEDVIGEIENEGTRWEDANAHDVHRLAEWYRKYLSIKPDEETGMIASKDLFESIPTLDELNKRKEAVSKDKVEKAANILRGLGFNIKSQPIGTLTYVSPIYTIRAIHHPMDSAEIRYLFIEPEGKSFLWSDDNGDTVTYRYLDKKDAEQDLELFDKDVDAEIDEDDSALVTRVRLIELANRLAGKEGEDREGLEIMGQVLESFTESEYELWVGGLNELFPGQVDLGWTEDSEPVFGLNGWKIGSVESFWGTGPDWEYVDRLDRQFFQNSRSYICYNREKIGGHISFFFLDFSEAKDAAIKLNMSIVEGKTEVLDELAIFNVFNKLKMEMSSDIVGWAITNQITEKDLQKEAMI